MSTVIGLADVLGTQIQRGSPGLKNWSKRQFDGFTPRDRDDLAKWSVGDRLVSISGSDMGTFAMLYEGKRPWASWGVVRQGRSVLLWDCVTHADIGLFASMIDALAAVPIAERPAPVVNVLSFVARGRSAATGRAER
ncbi:MAG: hypothetical protein RQ966_12665 [Acetobacteraceae bacterium]|nr:hypothetical protein [Acetobacteraceae bacterium]